jgi:hypothetical protein
LSSGVHGISPLWYQLKLNWHAWRNKYWNHHPYSVESVGQCWVLGQTKCGVCVYRNVISLMMKKSYVLLLANWLPLSSFVVASFFLGYMGLFALFVVQFWYEVDECFLSSLFFSCSPRSFQHKAGVDGLRRIWGLIYCSTISISSSLHCRKY